MGAYFNMPEKQFRPFMHFLFLFWFACVTPLQSLEFSNYNNASIEVHPFKEEVVDSDVYIRPFKDTEIEFPRYLLQFHDFPKDEEISVLIQRVAQEREQWVHMYRFSIRPSGMLMDQGVPIGFMLCLSARGFIPGERVNFRFETDRGFQKEISFIPYPLVFKSRMGMTLIKAELLSIDPTFFRLEFPGLKRGEMVVISSLSQGRTQGPFKHDGSTPFIFSPDVPNCNGGTGMLTVAKRTTKHFKMELPWGAALLKHYGSPKFFHP
ncbi:hypothetical protein PHSC3_000367 [Chlamydiales bacterium STE3]|nr:hypothetical protein PHSC3_000367 [Chlamydiales bacterium STE3]